MTKPSHAPSRAEILARFRAQIARGEPIIGGGAGTGISAKSEEAGGIDLLIVYNSGRYRMAGRGSTAGLMPYGNANQIVKEMAFEVLPVVERTPVLAGVCGTDPFMIPRLFLSELQELGFAGIQNFPTVGLIEGELRATLEETGMGFGCEVDVVRLAHEYDMLTTPYAFDPGEAVAMTEAGADIVVAHMGCTSGGTIGAKSVKTLDSCVARIQAIVDAVKRVRAGAICLCHGGPIALPEDAQRVIDRVEGLDGFYGASSTERLPTELAIKAQIEAFKRIRLPKRGARSARGGSKRRAAAGRKHR
jgi:predicted TIM-barrel enzyme